MCIRLAGCPGDTLTTVSVVADGVRELAEAACWLKNKR